MPGRSTLFQIVFKTETWQGHQTDRFGKLSVRKAINPLQFSKGNFHLELSKVKA